MVQNEVIGDFILETLKKQLLQQIEISGWNGHEIGSVTFLAQKQIIEQNEQVLLIILDMYMTMGLIKVLDGKNHLHSELHMLQQHEVLILRE